MINSILPLLSRLTTAIVLFFLIGAASAQQARFIQVAPLSGAESGTAVDFIIDGQQVISNMPYGAYTDFLQLMLGDLDITVRRSSDDSLLVSETITLDSGGPHWLYLIGNGEEQPYELIHRDSTIPFIGGGDVPTFLLNAAIVDGLEPLLMTSADGSGAGASPGGVSPVDFGEMEYILRQSGTRDYKFTTPDGRINRIDLAPMELSAPPINDIWQLVIIGDGDQYPLSVLAVPGGQLDLLDPVDYSSLGWWDTVNTASAEGLLIHPLPSQNRIVGTIYSYADDDSGAQTWYTFDGVLSDRSVLAEVFASTGGNLGGDEPTTLEPAGTLALDFDDCQSGNAELSLQTGTEVHWELERLTTGIECSWDVE